MRVLVVEDEDALRDQIALRLRSEGFAVDVAGDGEEGLYIGMEYPVDIGIVDLGLPKLDGIELIRRLRARGVKFPILILTARARWQEKVEGLGAGADDYLVKPFHMEELLARLRALLRRSAGLASAQIEYGPVLLDTNTQSVKVGDETLNLTAFEYKMLEYFMLNPGKVISKFELTDHIYEEDQDRDSNVIEVLIGRLRRKLDPDNSLRPIETLRGRGYRFSIPPDS